MSGQQQIIRRIISHRTNDLGNAIVGVTHLLVDRSNAHDPLFTPESTAHEFSERFNKRLLFLDN